MAQGYDLLGLLFKAVKDKNYLLESRVLSQVILRPEDDLDKNKLLKRLAFSLEQVGDSLSKVSKTDPQYVTYRRYLCDYVFLSAQILDYAGELDKALIEYQAAQKAYTEFNHHDLAKELDAPIARLQRLKRQ
jgi:hypothetical protein